MSEVPQLAPEESYRRGVFAYEVAGVRHLADPLKVIRKMLAACPEYDRHVARLFAFTPAPADAAEAPEESFRRTMDVMESAATLEPAVLAGFNLQPLADDGSGVSIDECLKLLGSFVGWQARRDLYRAAAEAGAAPESPEVSMAAEPEPEPEPAAA